MKTGYLLIFYEANGNQGIVFDTCHARYIQLQEECGDRLKRVKTFDSNTRAHPHCGLGCLHGGKKP